MSKSGRGIKKGAKPPGTRDQGDTWAPHEDDVSFAASYGYTIQYMWRRSGKEMARMVCPCGNTYDMWWNNFKPAQKRFGCVECKNARMRYTVIDWAAKNDLLAPLDYGNVHTTYTWTCIRGHAFQDTATYLKKIKKDKGLSICPHCEIAQIEWSRDVTLLVHQPCTLQEFKARRHVRKWSCNVCTKTFMCSIAKMGLVGGCEAHQ